MHHLSSNPAIAVSDFALDLVSCTPLSGRGAIVARLDVHIGPDSYPALVNARGYCMLPAGPADEALREAVKTEAVRVALMSLREAEIRGRRAHDIIGRIVHNTGKRPTPQNASRGHRPEAAA